MTRYLISFPGDAPVLTEAELPVVVAESTAVLEEAKAAGVLVFAGGIVGAVTPVRVSADGTVSAELYAGSNLTGGLTVLELPTREEALEWASRMAAACRCAQEVREIV